MSETAPWAESEGPQRDREGAIDEDLYCLTCGYNLRGLSGDPIRCPECGEANELGTLVIPATRIREALRDMETAPTSCAGCFFGFVLFAPLLLTGRPEAMAFAGIVMVCTLSGWIVAYREMRRDYDNRPGWRSNLWTYHLALMLCVTVVLLPLGLWVYYATRRRIVKMQRDKAVGVAREMIYKQMSRPRYRLGH